MFLVARPCYRPRSDQASCRESSVSQPNEQIWYEKTYFTDTLNQRLIAINTSDCIIISFIILTSRLGCFFLSIFSLLLGILSLELGVLSLILSLLLALFLSLSGLALLDGLLDGVFEVALPESSLADFSSFAAWRAFFAFSASFVDNEGAAGSSSARAFFELSPLLGVSLKQEQGGHVVYVDRKAFWKTCSLLALKSWKS